MGHLAQFPGFPAFAKPWVSPDLGTPFSSSMSRRNPVGASSPGWPEVPAVPGTRTGGLRRVGAGRGVRERDALDIVDSIGREQVATNIAVVTSGLPTLA